MTSPEIFARSWSGSSTIPGSTSATNPRSPSRATTSAARSAAGRCSWCAGPRPGRSTCSTTPAPTAARGLPPGPRQRQGLPVLLPRLDLRHRGPAHGRARPRRLRREARLRRARAEAGGPGGELPRVCVRQLRPRHRRPGRLPGRGQEYLDLVVDAADGQMEIVKGTNEYCIGANWKLLAENSIDGYHAVSTHDTYFKYLVALGTDLPAASGHGQRPGQRARRAGVPRAVGPSGRQVGAAVRRGRPDRDRRAAGRLGRPARRGTRHAGWPTSTATC